MSTAVVSETEETVVPLVQPHVREAIRQLLVQVDEVAAGVSASPVEVEPNPVVAGPPSLTPREREVLELLVKGMRNKEMAVALGIAADTVRVHVKSIFSKLNVHTRTAAMAVALRRGLAHV